MPMIAEAMTALKNAGLNAGLFSKVKSNPVESNVYDGLEIMRADKHDGVIAFGGGSALDVGKVIAFMAGQTRPMWDFEDVGDWWTRANPDGIAPIVAVPTTAGTGSEVGRAGVITQEATHTKKVIFHPAMMPKITICDPALIVALPAKLTAGTGMDALAHCLEAYCAPGYHPMADGIAVEGIRLVKKSLARAVKDGANMDARSDMMSAAAMGATAFQKGLGAIHSLSHPVGALYDTHHGLTNAVFMPYVLAFNRVAIEERICRLAAYIGLEGSFDAFQSWILALRSEIGIAHTLAELNIPTDRIDEIAAMAIADPTAGGNPIELTLEGAKDGTLIHFNETWNPAVLSVIQHQAKGDAALLLRLAAALDYDLDASGFRAGAAFVAGTWGDYGDAWAAALSLANDQHFENETNQQLIDACAVSLAPVGNPAEVAALLRARGIHLGIATNDAERAAQNQAEALGLTPHLSFIAGYDSGFGAKPAPGMVHGFARHIGADTARIGLVGDSIHDMDAAKRAGAIAIGVLTGPLSREELAAHADHVIDSIADLPDLLDRLGAGRLGVLEHAGQASISTSS
eukprot:gene13174-13279_t